MNSSNDVIDESRDVRRYAMRLIVVAASVMSLVQILNSQPLQSANDRSRWATVWSLVERGTFQIDEIDARPGWGTIDKVRHEGHFYSSKPPLQSTLVAGVYWCVKRVTGWNLDHDTAEVSRLILLIINWLPRVLSLILISMLVEWNARRDISKLFVLTVASWGTLLGPFSSSLNNHFPAAVCTLITMFAALRILNDGERRVRFFVITGVFAGCTFCFELPAALLVVVFGALLLKADARRTLFAFVPAALIPMTAFAVTNWLATGGAMPFYSSYGSDKYVYEHEGVPSYWSNPQGLDRNLDSPLLYFVHCTVGHHGLLSLTPVFLLTFIGWLRWNRWEQCRQRTMLIVGAAMTVIVLGFYLSKTQHYNYGGNSVALRWMLWLTPLWLIAMIPVLDAWGTRRWFRCLASVLLIASITSASLPGGNPWQHPWLFTLMERWGWIDYTEPAPAFNFKHKLWSWFPKLGDPTAKEASFVKFVGTGSSLLTPDSAFDKSTVGKFDLSLSTNPNGDSALAGIQSIQFIWNAESTTTNKRSAVISVNVAAFNSGKKSSEFLRSSTTTPLQRDELIALQRLATGLPQAVEFHPGHIRYLKTPLRSNKAFRCQRAAAQTLFQPQHADHPLRYRCDLWLCEEIPFGVAQLEITISDPETTQTLTFQRLTAVEATGFTPQKR
ncbi:MAG: hypothetical protein NT013_05345 [Planctomycetia bacterium]|nr:hypothetical protein [Planctomycetia bacterium]